MFMLLKPTVEKLYNNSRCEEGFMAPEQQNNSQNIFTWQGSGNGRPSDTVGEASHEPAPEIFSVRSNIEQISSADLLAHPQP